MGVSCRENNVYVVGPAARPFSAAGIVSKYFIIRDLSGGRAEEGAFRLDDVYTCLYYDDIRCLAFVVEAGTSYTVKLFFRQDADYEKAKKDLKDNSEVKLSKQDAKIGSYAKNLVKRLNGGDRPLVVDAVDENDVLRCPVCGTQYEPGAQWCMECGSELPH